MKRSWMCVAAVLLLALQGQGPAQVRRGGRASAEVTPDLGPWMILTASYTGTLAKEHSAKLLKEMRDNYKLPAYVYNYGDEERRKEAERIRVLKEQHKRFLTQMNLSPATPFRVRTRRFEDQCAILIGGFKDEKSARAALARIKKLKPPDPKKVALASVFILKPKTKKAELTYVSPFQNSFVVPNPTVKVNKKADHNRPDPLLKKFNANETFNLLKCSKKYTLVVGQFGGATVVAPESGDRNFLTKIGLGNSKGQSMAASAVNAHNVAELLRKLKLEAYVLHTRYYSLVTVGGFDRSDEPKLKNMQQQFAKLKLPSIPLLPRAVPMEIPRP